MKEYGEKTVLEKQVNHVMRKIEEDFTEKAAINYSVMVARVIFDTARQWTQNMKDRTNPLANFEKLHEDINFVRH